MLEVLIVLVIIGFVAYLVMTYVPMAAPVRTMVIAVGVLILALWLLNMAGIGNFHLGRLG